MLRLILFCGVWWVGPEVDVELAKCIAPKGTTIQVEKAYSGIKLAPPKMKQPTIIYQGSFEYAPKTYWKYYDCPSCRRNW